MTMVTIKDTAVQVNREPGENGENAVQSPRVKFSIRFKLASAIIALVSVIIITMALYVRMDSSEMLRTEIISFAQRETEHLAIIAEDAYKSGDDLSLISSIENLKKVPSIEYAYLLDNDNFCADES